MNHSSNVFDYAEGRGYGRPEGSRREKSEAKVGSVGEEKREQITQPGATVTALEVCMGKSERSISKEEREEGRGWERG